MHLHSHGRRLCPGGPTMSGGSQEGKRRFSASSPFGAEPLALEPAQQASPLQKRGWTAARLHTPTTVPQGLTSSPNGLEPVLVLKPSRRVMYADMTSANPQTICAATSWQSPCTFAKYYQLDSVANSDADRGANGVGANGNANRGNNSMDTNGSTNWDTSSCASCIGAGCIGYIL